MERGAAFLAYVDRGGGRGRVSTIILKKKGRRVEGEDKKKKKEGLHL